jgi:uncharacterized protein with PIN domain
METKFIADNNVGKLARWLRMMGYDALSFREKDDGELIEIALNEGRVILTKDTQIAKRRLVVSGRLKTVLIQEDDPECQLRQVVTALDLDYHLRPFSMCLECNQPLIPRSKAEVKNLVPPYVFRTQNEYMECPTCHRIYWRGTHWQAMVRQLAKFLRADNESCHQWT